MVVSDPIVETEIPIIHLSNIRVISNPVHALVEETEEERKEKMIKRKEE